MAESIGSVRIVLYAGLRGAEPIEVGDVMVPIMLAHARGSLEAKITEALEAVQEMFRQVFDES